MNCEFSEFSYGFAVSHELMDSVAGIKGMPVFPSLRAEARLGYDVMVPAGIPVFVQFKLPQFLTRRSAAHWSSYNSPHFRIGLRREAMSRQHNLLKSLSEFGNQVIYMAPSFHRSLEFDHALASGFIKRSAIFPLKVLPRIQNEDQYYITYQTSNTQRFLWHPEVEINDYCFAGSSWLASINRLLLEQQPASPDKAIILL